MLFRDFPDGSWLAISQPMHALVSGQMLRAWGRPPFLAPDPFEEVATACAQHDVAWMGWEAAPSLDPATGRPTLFHHLGARVHAPMWAEGVERAIAAWGPWVGLLVSRHGSRIYAAYQHRHRAAGAGAGADADAAAVAAYQSDQAALRARLAAASGATDRQVEDAAALVAVTDALSLAACGGVDTLGWTPQAPLAGGGTVPLRLREHGQDMMTVDPWPFLGAEVVLHWTARHFAPGTRFTDAAAMRAGLAAAPFVPVTVRLLPR
jgi:hypothetical protein